MAIMMSLEKRMRTVGIYPVCIERIQIANQMDITDTSNSSEEEIRIDKKFNKAKLEVALEFLLEELGISS